LINDQLGSLLAETDGAGASRGRFAAYPYGVSRYQTSPESRQYANAPRDRGVGLDLMGARFYAADLGIWTIGDPVLINNPEKTASAQFGTANPYVYSNLTPVIAVDSDGNFWNIIGGAFIGGVICGGAEAIRQYMATGKIEDGGRIWAAAAGGAVAGAIFGMNPAAGAPMLMLAGAAAGGASGVTQRLINSGGKSAGTVTEVLTDQAVGALTAGLLKGGSAVVRKAVTAVRAPAAAAVAKTAGSAADGAFSPIVEGGGLTAHEAAGGHLLARHVGLNAGQLDARGIDVASTFLTRAEAEAAASGALSQNAGRVSAWLQGGAANNLKITTPFTGGLIRLTGGYEASATSATFILKANSSGGFFFLTGFPAP